MIQARKVQYMCMSKLSPKELASRAHQFLAEGDRKKSQPAKVISFAQEGTISLCVLTFYIYCKLSFAMFHIHKLYIQICTVCVLEL